MLVVYVLKDTEGRLYKGMTNNLPRRFKEHCRGNTKTTKNMPSLEIVYTEEYNDSGIARLREKYFKSSAGRRFLKNKIMRV